LHGGQDYAELRPTYAIWLLAEHLLADAAGYAHDFQWRDRAGRVLVGHGGIWVLELSKFSAERIETDQPRWLKFFKDGEELDDATLPERMDTVEMRQAMNTLGHWSQVKLFLVWSSPSLT
jgi:hypothetical protein